MKDGFFCSNGKFENKEQGIQDEKLPVETQKSLKETKCDDFQRKSCSNCSLKMMLHKILPFTKWAPYYKPSHLLRDFIAGITVGLMAIPQGIAYANVAGLEPQYGLYSTIMPCFVYIIFGGCKDTTLGPTAIMALMTYPYASTYGPLYAVLLCFLSGVVMILLAFFQLGFLVDFISLPVTVGFTAAAAFTIASAQIKNFLGLKVKSSNAVVDSWLTVFQNLDKISWPDTILGICTIAALLLGRYLKLKSQTFQGEKITQKVISHSLWLIGLSGNAIVVICGSLLAYFLSQNGISPFILTGNVNGGLPPIEIPKFSTSNDTFIKIVENMGISVISVPLISIMETIAIGKAFEKGKSVDATQEMIALGWSNIAGAFVSSMPISGSFTRSAINNSSGVKTPLGGLFTGLLVLMALSFLTSLFFYIPKATLAGLIITAMIFMVEYHTIRVIWQTKKSDVVPLFSAFFSSLYFGIEVGIGVGIAINLCFVLYGIARPSIKMTWLTINEQKVLYIVPMQNILFPATSHIRETIIQNVKEKKDYNPVIIDGSNVYKIDSTTAKGIASLHDDLKVREQKFVLWKWNESPVRTILNFNEKMKKCLRYEEKLEETINESARLSIGENTSVQEFSNNNSNEQLTNYPHAV